MKQLYIIKAGTTFADTAQRCGDFEQMIVRGLQVEPGEIRVIDACRDEALPDPGSCRGVLITGAHCMVTDNLPWSLAIESWIPQLVRQEVPLLGICYGHQLLGRAMGGRVDYHPHGREVGTFSVNRHPAGDDDPLFSGLPRQFPVHATHAQSVLDLPPGSTLLAGNDFEPHHAFRLGRCAWGVQFHPEYDRSVMRDYILGQAENLAADGRDVQILLRNLSDTPEAGSLLKSFAQLTNGTTGR